MDMKVIVLLWLIIDCYRSKNYYKYVSELAYVVISNKN
jgi:hypothetical protein